jgi:2-polyprenyl-3-methyl-5-hydroxy-6-metoxy-1,4-benzoquinol methylase
MWKLNPHGNLVVKVLQDPSPNSVEETYWEKAAKTRLGKYLTSIESEFISNSINLSKSSLVLDVGAEAGRFSMLAANKCLNVTGIDIDSRSLRRLKAKNKDVTVIQADARKMPLRTGYFDAVLMIEVLDYITELTQTFEECSRIIKPGASVILSFGNQSSLKAKIKAIKGKSYLHSYSNALKSLKKTGFTIKSKLGYNWLPFGRTSQSRIIPFFAGTEKLLRLRKIPSLSPWVIIHAIKPK